LAKWSAPTAPARPTFYMTVGLTAPDAGRVILDGHDVTDDPIYIRAARGSAISPGALDLPPDGRANMLAILETMGPRRDAPHPTPRTAGGTDLTCWRGLRPRCGRERRRAEIRARW
jgi:hypothetical protein